MEPDDKDKETREAQDAPETPDVEEDESFAELLDRTFVAPARYEPGQKVAARVIKVTPEWIFLDLGRKGEGILATKELADESGNVPVKEGDSLASYFVHSDGSEMLFTTKVAGGAAGSAQLEEASRTGIPVDGQVVKEVKGGFEVRLPGGARAFCPHSQMGSPRGREAAENYIGKRVSFRITKYERERAQHRRLEPRAGRGRGAAEAGRIDGDPDGRDGGPGEGDLHPRFRGLRRHRPDRGAAADIRRSAGSGSRTSTRSFPWGRRSRWRSPASIGRTSGSPSA